MLPPDTWATHEWDSPWLAGGGNAYEELLKNNDLLTGIQIHGQGAGTLIESSPGCRERKAGVVNLIGWEFDSEEDAENHHVPLNISCSCDIVSFLIKCKHSRGLLFNSMTAIELCKTCTAFWTHTQVKFFIMWFGAVTLWKTFRLTRSVQEWHFN